MQKIYVVYSEEYGEVQGVYKEDGEFLDMWCSNDANFREEYFSLFLEKLGIEVAIPSPDTYKNLHADLTKRAEKEYY